MIWSNVLHTNYHWAICCQLYTLVYIWYFHSFFSSMLILSPSLQTFLLSQNLCTYFAYRLDHMPVHQLTINLFYLSHCSSLPGGQALSSDPGSTPYVRMQSLAMIAALLCSFGVEAKCCAITRQQACVFASFESFLFIISFADAFTTPGVQVINYPT